MQQKDRHGLTERVFHIFTDGRPVAAVSAFTLQEAHAYRRETWFRNELSRMNVILGAPAWNGKSPLEVRRASAAESERYERARKDAIERGEHDPDEEEFVLYLAIPSNGRTLRESRARTAIASDERREADKSRPLS